MLRPAIEGSFASENPRAQTLAGVGALVASEPDGIEVCAFGWADLDTGRASNERTNARQQIGFVIPVCGTWQRVYVNLGKRWIRPGLETTLMSRGDFWVRFADGAIRGQNVYANPLDGAPISGYAVGAELTPWFVITSCEPGKLAVISTWSNST